MAESAHADVQAKGELRIPRALQRNVHYERERKRDFRGAFIHHAYILSEKLVRFTCVCARVICTIDFWHEAARFDCALLQWLFFNRSRLSAYELVRGVYMLAKEREGKESLAMPSRFCRV